MVQIVAVGNLIPGMVTATVVWGLDGKVLLAKGAMITSKTIKRLLKLNILQVKVECPRGVSIEVSAELAEETSIRALAAVRQAVDSFLATKSIAFGSYRQITTDIVVEVLRDAHILFHLNAIRMYDDYTFAHSVNVCIMSVLFGASLQYDRRQLLELATGAILHDVGKLGISKQILNKEGMLTQNERDCLCSHPRLGFTLLRQYSSHLPDSVLCVTHQHQEYYDGQGYPLGLAGTDILEYARITAITDVYDALTSDRPYRARLSPRQAYDLMLARTGTQFDPKLLNKFMEHIALYQAGNMVRLNTGDVGIVTELALGIQERALVSLLINTKGHLYTTPTTVDLRVEPNVYVERVLEPEQMAEIMQQLEVGVPFINDYAS